METEICRLKNDISIKIQTKYDHQIPIPVGFEQAYVPPPFILLHTAFKGRDQWRKGGFCTAVQVIVGLA